MVRATAYVRPRNGPKESHSKEKNPTQIRPQAKERRYLTKDDRSSIYNPGVTLLDRHPLHFCTAIYIGSIQLHYLNMSPFEISIKKYNLLFVESFVMVNAVAELNRIPGRCFS